MYRFRITAVISAMLAGLIGCSGQDEAMRIPESVIRENTLGTAFLGQQEWDLAAEAFRRGLAAQGQEPLLLSNLAVALLQAGNVDEAEVYLREATAVDPNYPYANYTLGLIESDRGNFAAAVEHFQIVAEFDSTDVFTQYNLGVAYSSLGEGDLAVAAMRRALELDADHVSSLYALGRELVTQGNRDEGRELIDRSQEIRSRSGLDTAVGSQYGEQGPFALGVDYAGDLLGVPDPIDVSFAAVSRYATNDPQSVWAATRMAPDGDPAIVVTSGSALFYLTPGAEPRELLAAHAGGGRLLALAAGDGDNDEVVELYGLLSGQEQGVELVIIEQSTEGQFSWADGTGIDGDLQIPDQLAAADLMLFDREHDGDLDLVICWAPSAATACGIATNDGAGGFALRPSTDHGFDFSLAATDFVRLASSDIDNDRDIDFIVAERSGIHVLTNQRDGNFVSRENQMGLTGDLRLQDAVLADVNKDGWMDVVAGTEQGVSLMTNRRGRFAPPISIAIGARSIESVTVMDADNDGFLDILAAGPDGAVAYRNIGSGQWRPMDEWLEAAGSVMPMAAIDADRDGDLDLVSAPRGSVEIFANNGGNSNHWISVDSRGVGDNRFGVGAKIEILAGALRQKFEIAEPLPLHAGLGSRTQVDSVRYLWPSGVLQDEIEKGAGQPLEVTQLDRKGTSCPILYVWQNGEWRFVTDFLGGSAIGYQVSPGVFSTPDTDEYVKLEQAPSVDRDGRVRLRVNNQLQEIIWFDQLELLAIDHPLGSEVFPNERLMPGPPWPAFQLFVSDDVRAIASARSVEIAKDSSAELSAADGRYVEDFELLRFKGYAKTHTLELDLGSFDPGERIVLLLDGWIDYADSTANVAAAQAGVSLMAPVLTVADGHGGWSETGHLMGFPAGLPKTIAVDLTGLLPSEDHRVRIATNMRIYWDQARILVGGAELPYDVQRLAPVSADLRNGGFPRELSRSGQTPYRYNPTSVSLVSPWSAHVGRYTTFGDVRGLVQAIDDRMVTTRSGDEIELTFLAPGTVAEGYTRTYMLYADGFGKDMDANSAANAAVGPMPFHGMPTYPYAEGIQPPVDLADTMTRIVTESDHAWPGALPLALAPVARLNDGVSE